MIRTLSGRGDLSASKNSGPVWDACGLGCCLLTSRPRESSCCYTPKKNVICPSKQNGPGLHYI